MLRNDFYKNIVRNLPVPKLFIGEIVPWKDRRWFLSLSPFFMLHNFLLPFSYSHSVVALVLLGNTHAIIIIIKLEARSPQEMSDYSGDEKGFRHYHCTSQPSAQLVNEQSSPCGNALPSRGSSCLECLSPAGQCVS